MRIILQSLSPSGPWFLLEIHPCPLSWSWYSGLIQFPVPCSGQFLLMMMMNSTLHLCQRQHLLDVIKITFSILCFHNELYTTCSRKALVYCPDVGVQSLSLERIHGGTISSKCQPGRKAVTVPWDFPHHCLVDYENVKKKKNKPGKVELFIYWLFYLLLNRVRIISGGNFHNFIFLNNTSLIAPSNSIISLLKQHFPEIALTDIFLVHSHKGFCFKKNVLFEFIFSPETHLYYSEGLMTSATS